MIEFYGTLLAHLPQFLGIFAAVCALHAVLLRKHVFSIFDPLFYYFVVSEAFCAADVVFMGIHGLIETRYLVGYLLSEGALFLGFLRFAPRRPPPLPEPRPAAGPMGPAFTISFVLFVVLSAVVYVQRGVPLLVENRLEIYTVGGGWGLVTRALDVLLVVIVYYLMEVFYAVGWSIREWAVLLTVVVLQVLSGSKSAVQIVVFIVALHAYFTGAWVGGAGKLRRTVVRLGVLAVAGFLIVAQVQKADLEVDGIQLSLFGQAALRLVNNGDAFIYTYPGEFIEELDGSNAPAALLREYLGFFRIATPDELPQHLGVQISRAFFGPDSSTQTNAKHNIFGYVYFGEVGAIVFSFLLGACIGAVRYRLLEVLPRDWSAGVAWVLLNLAFVPAVNEWDYASRGVINAIVLYVPSLLALRAMGRYRKGKALRECAPPAGAEP